MIHMALLASALPALVHFLGADDRTDFVPERYVYSRCCGSLWYEIGADGSLGGHYPEQKGRIVGRIDAEGNAVGHWFQPRSDHPCATRRGGTFAWGRFEFHDVGGNAMSGEWGYCGDAPTHDWGFE